MQDPVALLSHCGPVCGEKEPELIFVPLNPGVCCFFLILLFEECFTLLNLF